MAQVGHCLLYTEDSCRTKNFIARIEVVMQSFGTNKNPGMNSIITAYNLTLYFNRLVTSLDPLSLQIKAYVSLYLLIHVILNKVFK